MPSSSSPFSSFPNFFFTLLSIFVLLFSVSPAYAINKSAKSDSLILPVMGFGFFLSNYNR